MPSITYWSLRRRAGRAKRVTARRGGENEALKLAGITLPAKADAYMASYDWASQHQARRRRESAGGPEAIADLSMTVRTWMPFAVRAIQQFKSTGSVDNPDVPDTLLEDACRFWEVFGAATGKDGKPLAYDADARTHVDETTKKAARGWGEPAHAFRWCVAHALRCVSRFPSRTL